MSKEVKKTIGYDITPLTEDDFKGMQTTCGRACLLSGVFITRNGGPKPIISEEAYDLLLHNKDLKSKVRKLIRDEIIKQKQFRL